jgi:hypothetical protein
LTSTTFSVNTSTIQSRVNGSCSAGTAMQSIGQTGTVACGAVATGPGQVLAPTVIQIGFGEQVLLSANGIQIVGKCSSTSADVVLRSQGANVLSDSRKISRGQTTFGDVVIGTGDGNSALDRGDFNAVNISDSKTLNGSFYVFFTTQGCQFNASGLAS